MKDGKTSDGSIQERAIKRNWFDPQLTSQTSLQHPFERKIPIQSRLWPQPGIEPILLPCSIFYQIIANFSTFENLYDSDFKQQLFSKKKDFGQMQRINVGKNNPEVADTLRAK